MKHWVVIILCSGHNLCETVTTAVGESWNLVLLSVTVEATWFANVLSVARCVTRFDVSLTCHAVFEKIAGHVTWQITMSGLSHGHKCLPGLLWWTAGRNDNTRNCLFVSSIAFLLCYKKKINKIWSILSLLVGLFSFRSELKCFFCCSLIFQL